MITLVLRLLLLKLLPQTYVWWTHKWRSGVSLWCDM
jgi:hypothetical protein